MFWLKKILAKFKYIDFYLFSEKPVVLPTTILSNSARSRELA